jgi:hypothetical protein
MNREAARVPTLSIAIDHQVYLVAEGLKGEGIVADEHLRALGYGKGTSADECDAELHGRVPSLEVTE